MANTYQMTSEMPKPVAAIRLKDPLIEDLGVPAATVQTASFPGPLPKAERVRLDLGDAPFTAELGAAVLREVEALLPEKGIVLVITHAPFDAAAIAAFRAAVWPSWNVFRAYQLTDQLHVRRFDAEGSRLLTKQFPAVSDGSALAMQRRAAALAPDAIEKKFDKNAAGWNGDPKSPLYPHHRWMRRIVAELGAPRPGERTLDAGCGAGWIGIEAAKLGAAVCAFDPSPEMVKLTGENAAAEDAKVEALVGFVEKSPFAESFTLVLNSGVLSFAPDVDRYLDALDALTSGGGRLVIADLNPLSSGMRKRRAARAVLPIREMNALPRADVIARLEKRGYRITARRFYQLTTPVPELMHFCAAKLGGFGCRALLRRNEKAATRDSEDVERFDSWLLRAEKP